MIELGRTVLGVEADDDLRALLQKFIAAIEGTDCVTCGSAEVALGLLAERGCDAIVSDFRMEGMDGVSFAALVARRWPGTPVIIITGGASVDEDAPGVFCTLQKPFSRSDLSRALDRAFAARQQLL